MGVAFMDSEHEGLMGIFGNIRRTPDSVQGRAQLRDLFKALVTQTRQHFAHEEHEMREHDFPMLPGHVAQHAKYVEELEELALRFDARQSVAAMQKQAASKEYWFVNHIKVSDRPLANWLLEAQGAQGTLLSDAVTSAPHSGT